MAKVTARHAFTHTSLSSVDLRAHSGHPTMVRHSRLQGIGKHEFPSRSSGSDWQRMFAGVLETPGNPWKCLSGSNDTLYLGRAKLLVSTVVRRDGKGEVILNGRSTGSLTYLRRLMPNAVPLTPRSRRRHISRLNRELESGERQRCVPVSNLPLRFSIDHLRSLCLDRTVSLCQIRALRWVYSTREMRRVYVCVVICCVQKELNKFQRFGLLTPDQTPRTPQDNPSLSVSQQQGRRVSANRSEGQRRRRERERRERGLSQQQSTVSVFAHVSICVLTYKR